MKTKILRKWTIKALGLRVLSAKRRIVLASTMLVSSAMFLQPGYATTTTDPRVQGMGSGTYTCAHPVATAHPATILIGAKESAGMWHGTLGDSGFGWDIEISFPPLTSTFSGSITCGHITDDTSFTLTGGVLFDAAAGCAPSTETITISGNSGTGAVITFTGSAGDTGVFAGNVKC